jgi:hypothetical protein
VSRVVRAWRRGLCRGRRAQTRLGLYFLAANLVGIAAGFTVNHAFGVSYVWGGAA